MNELREAIRKKLGPYINSPVIDAILALTDQAEQRAQERTATAWDQGHAAGRRDAHRDRDSRAYDGRWLHDDEQLELKSQLYGWLGDRTADPDGDEWQHEPLQQLVHDLLALPELAALRAKADS